MALADNIVAYWKMTGNSNDSVGSNNGTDTSITYGASTGIIDQGAIFASSNPSYISIADTSFPAGSSNRTFNMWYKPSAQGNQMLFYYGTPALNQSQGIYYNGSILEYNNFGADLDISQTLSNGTWYMLTATYNGTTAELFVNSSSIGSGARSFNTTSSLGLAKFGRDNLANYPLDGTLDEVGIWSRVLSGAQLTQLYNAGAGLQYPFTTSSAVTPHNLPLMGVGS